MTNFNKSQNSKKSDETSSRKESLSEMRKLDPDLVEVFLQIRPKVDTPKSLDEKIHKMCMDHENNKHEKLDWIKWLSSIFLQRPKFLNSLGMYWNPLFVQNLRALMYSFAGLFLIVLATIAYYQYIKHQSTPTDIIAGQETPIIKVSPNPTDTPIATPSPIESIAPKVATNPNNNDNIRQDGTKEEDKQQAITNEDTKPRKPEEPKDLDKENDKIAMNTVPNNSSATRAVKELSKRQILTMKKLKTLRTIIIDDSLEQDIRQEIEKEIENSPNWEIATDADAMFKVVDNKLMLVNQSGEVLWFVNNHKTKYKSKVKYIKYIRSKIKYLSNLSNVKSKK